MSGPIPLPEELSDAEVAALDELACSLPSLRVPDSVVLGTRDALRAAFEEEARASTSRRPRRWLPAGAALGLAIAASMLLWVDVAPPVVGTEMVARGTGTSLPDLSLKLAVESDGAVSRYDAIRGLQAGDHLLFRVGVDRTAFVALVRATTDGAAVLASQQMEPGETDVRVGEDLLAWEVEPEEPDAVYVVLASELPLPSTEVLSRQDAALGGLDVGAMCARWDGLGVRCDGLKVRVNR